MQYATKPKPQSKPLSTPPLIHTDKNPSDAPSSGQASTVSTRGKLLSRPVLLAGIAVICLIFFALTTPRSVPSVMLIAGFVVLGVLLYCLLKLGLLVTGTYDKLPPVYARGLLAAGTVLPIALLMMQSIGQLTVRDVMTLGGLFAVGIFYIGRMARAR